MLGKTNPALFEEVADFTVQQIRSSATSFEEADYALRKALFEHHKAGQDYISAANALAGIALENSSTLADAAVDTKANAVAHADLQTSQTNALDGVRNTSNAEREKLSVAVKDVAAALASFEDTSNAMQLATKATVEANAAAIKVNADAQAHLEKGLRLFD